MYAPFVTAAALGIGLILTVPALADEDLGIGLKAGTLGVGLEATWRPLPYLDLRLGGNMFDYDDQGSQAGINYDGTLALETLYATANLHFPLSPFRLTLGAYSNGNELELTSLPAASLDIGGNIYTAAEAGTLTSTTSFASTAPYLGVGYDFSLFGRVGLNLDFGVLWQGEPEVTLVADGLAAGDPGFQSALAVERQELEDEVSDLKVWPVVSVGFVVNFL